MENESILTSIKKLLGIVEDYEQFDKDIIIHINSVLGILFQMGVGDKAFSISDKSSTWTDYLGDNANLEMVKSYIHLKVRLLFDPPMSTAVTESINRMISELEWRINLTMEVLNE